MRVAATTTIWLICLAVSIIGQAKADILEVEPDLFPDLTLLDDKFPGVTLSNVTDANEKRILVRGVGTDIPMTGQYVFGCEITTSGQPRSLRLFGDWLDDREDPDAAKLRADFVRPVDFVSIQASTPDNGGYRLEAYDASGDLLEFDNPTGENTVLNASITRAQRDIAYILAWGVAEQDVSGPTDNLQVNFDTLPVFIDIKPRDDQNRINICQGRTLPVAILSFPKFSEDFFFDATQVDPFSDRSGEVR